MKLYTSTTYWTAIIILILYPHPVSFCIPTGVTILVHGTWSSNEKWCQPGGNFFDALAHAITAKKHSLISFTWSGKLDNDSRTQAGINLAHLIASYPSNVPIALVTHSHGGNVGIVASQQLAKKNMYHRIEHFFALATPTNNGSYKPNMKTIKNFYNLFSLQDMVQPVLGIFGRVYESQERIKNIRLFINNKQPDHTQMHDPVVALSLFEIPTLLAKNPDPITPIYINVTDTEPPTLHYDTKIQKLLEQDRWIQHNVVTSLFRHRLPMSQCHLETLHHHHIKP